MCVEDKIVNKKYKQSPKESIDNNKPIGINYNMEIEKDRRINKESGIQIKTQVTKQDVMQKISNSTMCHALSTAEYLTLRICNENQTVNNIWNEYKNIFSKDKDYKPNTPIFGRYDAFDGGKTKPIKDLICQLIFQIENFKGDYLNYIKKYNGVYNFPGNLSKPQILKIILLWIIGLKKIEFNNGKFSEYGCSKYLDNLYNLISCQPTIDYSMDIYKLEANNPNYEQLNPEALIKAQILASNQLNNEIENNPENKDVNLFGQNNLKYINDNFN